MKTYQSEIAEAVHEIATDLRAVGAIGEGRMREYDRDCLLDPQPNGEEIRALRIGAKMEESDFARMLGVPRNRLAQWESGVRRPSGPALRLLQLAFRKGVDAIA